MRLSVTDAGEGFDSSSSDRLFDPFYSTKSDGMGVGLSVSRSIIESHGGRIEAMPNDGPGATVAFSLPGRPATAAEGRLAPPTCHDHPTARSADLQDHLVHVARAPRLSALQRRERLGCCVAWKCRVA